MQTQNRVGQQFGNYRLTKLIDSGGYAEVYLAQHIHLSNRQHAIKILTGTNLQDEQRDSFLIEARTVANLQHLSPHIVQIQDFGIQTSGNTAEDGIPYLVMEYAAEGTMRKLYSHDTQVPLDRIIFYIKQVAEALQCAHNQTPPIVHRDIKPENMLLRTHDHLLLSDFGIAITGQATSRVVSVKEKEIVGTVTYMAPERLSKRTRRASDQYSLGIVVYEWLSGSPPFDGTEKEIIYKQLVAPPPPLSAQYPHITKEIEDVVMRTLEKEPDDRYPSVQEFAFALEQAIQKVPQQKRSAPRGNVQPQQNIGAQLQGQVNQHLIAPPSTTVIQSQLPSMAATVPLSQVQPQLQAPPGPQAQPAQPQPQPAPVQPTPQTQPQPASPQAQTPAVQPPIVSTPPARFAPAPQQVQAQSLPAVAPQPFHYAGVTVLFPPKPRVAAIPPGENRGMQEFFDFSPRFFWQQDYDSFINIGIVLNVLSAILVGLVLRNYYALIAGLIFPLLMFVLCIYAVATRLAKFFGTLVALYWLVVGWIIGSFLASSLHLNPFLPPLFLSSVFFIASLALHFRYAARKNI